MFENIEDWTISSEASQREERSSTILCGVG